MISSDNQKTFFSSWQVAKFLWLAQALANLFFGIPMVVLFLLTIRVDWFIIQRVLLLYLSIYFFVYIPFNGFLSFILLKPIGKTLGKIYREEGAPAKDGLRAIRGILNLPLYFSSIVFVASFLGFVLGVYILWLGLIPELLPLIGVIIRIGLAIGFATCIIHFFLIYLFLEDYFRTQIEKLPPLYLKSIKAAKIRKLSFSWKIFFLTLFSVTVVQISLGSLYLGRVFFYSPEDIKNVLIYVGAVATLTLIYVVMVTVLFSRNLISPLKRIILWADKIIKGETKEEISIITDDELLEVIEYLKRMHEEIEEAKAVLEIKVKARTKELEELTERQEEIIQERIKEIQKRAEELERFQKLAVGRELKMIELKKEIEKLKKELGKYKK